MLTGAISDREERRMQRRLFLLAGLLSSTVLSTGFADQALTLIYVGGWDCPPCIGWKKNSKAGWLASPERAKINYIEIEAPKLKEVYQDRYWPAELRPVRDQLKDKWGTPRFLLVRDGKLLASEWGRGEWDRTFAKIRALTA
jgi:hypothetical protein